MPLRQEMRIESRGFVTLAEEKDVARRIGNLKRNSHIGIFRSIHGIYGIMLYNGHL